MATNVLQQDSHHEARQHTLLIATTDPDQRTFLAAELDADGHTIYEADSTTAAVAGSRPTRSTFSSSDACSGRPTLPRFYVRSAPASTGASTPLSRSSRST